MTTDDALNMVRIRGVVVSPDGQSVIYGKSELNWKENKRETTYFHVPAKGGDAYQYIGKDGASDLKYSPDGRYLAFKRKADDHAQLFVMRTDGGEAVQLTKHGNSVGSYEWTADSKAIYFKSDVIKSKEEKEKKKNGYDHYKVDEGANGQRPGEWSVLWRIGLENRKEQKVTGGDRIIGGFDVAPDGQRILYTARFENRRNQGNLSEIFLFNATDSSTTQLTDNNAPESRVKWAPDGQHFAYMASDDRDWELRNAKIWVMDVTNGSHHMLSGRFEGNINDYYWTPDGRAILFEGLHHTDTNIYRLVADNGRLVQLTDRKGTVDLEAVSSDREEMIFSFSDFRTPPDLYASSLNDFKPVRLTNLNPWIADSLQLAQAKIEHWKSSDGLEIEGIVYTPEGFEQNGESPFLLHIHGGPAGVFTNRFFTRYHVWAGLGYVQLTANVRGSSGYSDKLLRGNMYDIGDGDYHDLMTGVDKLIQNHYIDPDHMAVRGWSYGGILGGTVITKTDRFKAASLGAMVSDWSSEYGMGFNYDVRLWYIGGTPWTNAEDYRERSALKHATDVTTPTLLLHGGKDITDTPQQSLMFFTYLKDIGKTDVRYIKFPREPHGFREPRHQRTRDIEEIRWIQKYARGIDWKPWQRPEPKKDKGDS